ncbi:major facilitator superfamily domain-containing protein [Lipomyces mesembrius]
MQEDEVNRTAHTLSETNSEKDHHLVLEKGIGDSSNDSTSLSSFEDDETGVRTGKLNIPADWPPLATHEPKKYYFWNFHGPKGVDLDAAATQPSFYDDPERARLYQPLPDYENLHRFNPKARWTWREEIAVVGKIDMRIMSWCAVMFMAPQLDRGNISQAVADNMLDDLHFTANHYNNGNTIFKIFFLVSELPSQLVSKKLGPDRWIPIQMISWSIVAMCQSRLNSTASFYITRALLGALEGGFIADVCLYLSYYYYTGVELPVRLAYFWAGLTVSEIIAAFMGFGLLHMRGVQGREGWRWLFLVESAITACIGILSWLLCLLVLRKLRSWFRGKKETIIVNRVLRDDQSKGDMHNKAVDCLMFFVPSSPVDTYLTLTLRSMQFLHLVFLLAVTYISQRYNNRTYPGIAAQFWILATLIPLRTFGAHSNRWAKYIVTTLLLSYPSTHAIQEVWLHHISIDRTTDRLYHHGNSVLIGIAVLNVFIYIETKLYRHQKWNEFTH